MRKHAVREAVTTKMKESDPRIQMSFDKYSDSFKTIEGDASVMMDVIERQLAHDKLEQEIKLKKMEYDHLEAMKKLEHYAPELEGQISALMQQLAQEREKFSALQSALSHTVKVEVPQQQEPRRY